jgi:hypothetical protein
VAKEAAKVAVRKLRDGVVACEAVAEAQMYADDATAEESRVAAAAVVVAGNSAWLLVDSDETEVEDEDNDEAEAAAEAACDAELRVACCEGARQGGCRGGARRALGDRDGQGPRLPEERRSEECPSAVGCSPR